MLLFYKMFVNSLLNYYTFLGSKKCAKMTLKRT